MNSYEVTAKSEVKMLTASDKVLVLSWAGTRYTPVILRSQTQSNFKDLLRLLGPHGLCMGGGYSRKELRWREAGKWPPYTLARFQALRLMHPFS